jgi:hypothetical protein
MEWGLFVLAVLLVAALQFAVWRRLRSGEFGTSESPPSNSADAAPPADRFAGDGGTEDPDVTLCPNCGAHNDADYRFCRDCVNALHP